jgi:hypothetical protein
VTVTTSVTFSRLRVLTRAGVWTSAIGGLILPWGIMLAVDHFIHHLPFQRAWQSFRLHLFAPGYNLFMVGILTAVPFTILAVTILLHIGLSLQQKPIMVQRRAFALTCASTGMMGLTAWTHVDVLIHPDAQGALAYFLLPILLLLMLVVGYVVGRLLAPLLFPHRN